MNRRFALLGLGASLLTACANTAAPSRLGPDGKPLPKLYRITEGDARRIPYRVLDAVNALRQSAGRGELALSAELSAAAATHARDMAIQNRPWHFGSDGSSPIERAARVGYTGTLLGETLSETFESELETVAAWMQDVGPRSVLLNEEAQELGFAFHQEENGKIWWVLNTGRSDVAGQLPEARADVREAIFSAL